MCDVNSAHNEFPLGVVVVCAVDVGVLLVAAEFARRYCQEDGMWRGRPDQENSLGGWTNYSDCFIPEVKKLMDQLYSSSGDDAGVSNPTASRIVSLVNG